MKITTVNHKGHLYQTSPLPSGATMVGTIRRGEGGEGALVLLASGQYVQMNAGGVRTLHQGDVAKNLTEASPPEYCSQNDGECETCSLVSYGRDCQNQPL